MTITTKEDFLNIRIDDKTIRDYLDLIAEEESIEEKLQITNKILQKLKENKPYVTVSAKELLDKIVNLHNHHNDNDAKTAISTTRPIMGKWNRLKSRQ